MVTYVNTVLVGNGKGVVAEAPANASSMNSASADAGKYIVVDNNGDVLTAATAADAEIVKVGMITKKNVASVNHKTGALTFKPIIKWSNVIKKADIKSYNKLTYTEDVPESVEITLPTSVTELKNKRIVVRLTFKDLPTRYRKWTESYEVAVADDDTSATLATKIANKINKEYKRARVAAEAAGSVITLTAMPYDDDDTVDSISWANTNRFSVNMWMTDPMASGFASKNKYSVNGAKIEKTPGKVYAASAKLVRDMEANAMGYQGILNRGECTWPVIKPEMETKLDAHYNAITLEFENMYRAADDIQRHTKQALNIFDTNTTAVAAILDAFVKGEHKSVALGTKDAEVIAKD